MHCPAAATACNSHCLQQPLGSICSPCRHRHRVSPSHSLHCCTKLTHFVSAPAWMQARAGTPAALTAGHLHAPGTDQYSTPLGPCSAPALMGPPTPVGAATASGGGSGSMRQPASIKRGAEEMAAGASTAGAAVAAGAAGAAGTDALAAQEGGEAQQAKRSRLEQRRRAEAMEEEQQQGRDEPQCTEEVPEAAATSNPEGGQEQEQEQGQQQQPGVGGAAMAEAEAEGAAVAVAEAVSPAGDEAAVVAEAQGQEDAAPEDAGVLLALPPTQAMDWEAMTNDESAHESQLRRVTAPAPRLLRGCLLRLQLLPRCRQPRWVGVGGEGWGDRQVHWQAARQRHRVSLLVAAWLLGSRFGLLCWTSIHSRGS